ncbi:S-(hydroxymethyl)glutathione dehydrogenase / alcohol dehydrogenase [Abditibacterium utsteinense]|uniref:S-(Hydroxymethyl)glutathione dehydrogenase / alcohol dehydrogenase n=1 Tax=Abditibacterium utsteinense TaxID=1960156 RepID=A0A2S8SNY5_9BACT|nr:zinc-binding dehydrogenase [Abditibacterium utsteinense]PQV62498.1 S-(hydroxymethyl)glutathione dehydrogenase / alcohol dehydrogenase [Abditibacterium utsteinense]
MTQSKAAIFTGINQPLVIDEIEVDDPKAGEVLIKLDATGLCHTEIWYMSGGDTTTRGNSILGHEGCGTIVKVGAGVVDLQEGDRVVPIYIPECGHCRECLSDDTNLCSALDDAYFGGSMNDGSMRFHHRGRDLHHFMLTSTFSQYTVVHQEAVAKIRPDAPAESACLFGCAVTTGIGAALYTAKVKPGSKCAVFGVGPIGLNAIQGCKLAGAEMIIAVDLNDERLEKARQFGATHLIKPDGENGTGAVKDLTNGGADYVFEATGNTKVMRQALESTIYGGGVCCLIGVAKTGEVVEVTPRLLIAGRKLIGTAFGGCRGKTQLPGLIDMYMDGKIKVDELVTDVIDLSQINEAFENMKKDGGYRYVVRY